MADETGNDNGGKEAKDWDRQLAFRNAFLDQWRTELAPVDAMIELATESATSLALTGLRSVYLLNGGALIALPAFIEIFNKLNPGDTDLFSFCGYPFHFGFDYVRRGQFPLKEPFSKNSWNNRRRSCFVISSGLCFQYLSRRARLSPKSFPS